jgi:hypothetical protein
MLIADPLISFLFWWVTVKIYKIEEEFHSQIVGLNLYSKRCWRPGMGLRKIYVINKASSYYKVDRVRSKVQQGANRRLWVQALRAGRKYLAKSSFHKSLPPYYCLDDILKTKPLLNKVSCYRINSGRNIKASLG